MKAIRQKKKLSASWANGGKEPTPKGILTWPLSLVGLPTFATILVGFPTKRRRICSDGQIAEGWRGYRPSYLLVSAIRTFPFKVSRRVAMEPNISQLSRLCHRTANTHSGRITAHVSHSYHDMYGQ